MTMRFPPQIACFVCGAQGPADYPLFISPHGTTPDGTRLLPHFPFLGDLVPPMGLTLPPIDGNASSCRACYNNLLKQWDANEKGGVPLESRVYWTKRLDNLPVLQPEQQMSINAKHIARYPALLGYPKVAYPSSAPHTSTHQSKPMWMGCVSMPPVSASQVSWKKMGPPSTAPIVGGMSDSSHRVMPPTTGAVSSNPPSSQVADDNDSALDLSSGNRDRENMKSRSSVLSHVSATSHHSSYQSEGAGSSTDILDLTLPDKNAATEICYVCGDEYKKGLLSFVITRPTGGKVPYYSSLVHHPRPPRSRPMDSAGRVQCCDECIAFLLSQWEQFERDNVLHSDRNFKLRKRNSQIVDSATFVCYICALDYHSSHLQMIYVRQNSENEPYYPQIELHKPPPGASPISGGMVQVCSHCYKLTREKYQSIRASSSSTHFSSPSLNIIHHNPSHNHFEPPPKKRKSSRASVEILNDPDQSLDDDDKGGTSPADIECILCRRKFTVHSFKYLHSQGPPIGDRPYFPFLRTLHRLNDEGGFAYEDDSKGRVRACAMCNNSLINQWAIFQREAMPIENRNYHYQTIAGPQSSGRGTPGDTLAATPTSGRSLHSPNTPSGGALHLANKLQSSLPVSSSLPPSAAESVIRLTSLSSDGRVSAPVCVVNAPSELHIGGGGLKPALAANPQQPPRGAGGQATLQVPPQCPSPGSVNSGTSGEPANHKPSTSSFYCFLCSSNSELSFARNLYSEAQGKKAPYFPFMKDHMPKPRAETLREDGSALVCTFCYHSVMAQWNRFADSRPAVPVNARKYNINDYVCYVCGVKTYRKRIRALRVVEFPFLRTHRGQKGTLTMENGEMAAVCLDCFQSLKSQFAEAAKYGIPVEKRQYNWMQIPPPPEESGATLVTPKERLDKLGTS